MELWNRGEYISKLEFSIMFLDRPSVKPLHKPTAVSLYNRGR